MPYPVMNTLLDAGFPDGALNYWLSSFTRGLPDALIDTAVERFATVPSPMTAMLLEHFHGAVTRVAAERDRRPAPRGRLEPPHPVRLDRPGRHRREHRLDARDASPPCSPTWRPAAGSTTSATTRPTTPSAPPTARTTTGCARSSAATTPTTSSTSTTTSRRDGSQTVRLVRNPILCVGARRRSHGAGGLPTRPPRPWVGTGTPVARSSWRRLSPLAQRRSVAARRDRRFSFRQKATVPQVTAAVEESHQRKPLQMELSSPGAGLEPATFGL